ncbi:MAG: hypothetical protein A3H57_00070 [Candidatus Taylorbacteria bacterium RIFCSPLOWO2_02_FULL_43_11]|uniref:Uncharacterized protein n=1 Tax=Candidatus Taylorbacteria bacterium RIFCSPHIGHO2_02_FULL_43_32b TaxID=1802306 RepID=A0A1G2MLE5_9BACT|nr:MAG: hypothetical protein A2743_01900 [Candidatus Taylorbacteria bacterium RIFCSPHIGHO2_01_FULL_43_47]OHA23832.1 MAG: hypothetical protein A3C72_01365 [Candidatus Taylorbacteria bacterium RIFCSPHIGHO2_02_FULL_43_32b]OHA37461.1 MAG: hypothetical protein A3H57_00070 [Candidatus Taylorbacteria bacterium RIFCSPLOWO2_02_FULL_43_11]
MSKQYTKRNSLCRGMSIVEVIFYVVVMIILLITVVSTFFTIRTAYQEMKYSSELANSAMVTMDRMQREIRNAERIDFINSVLSTATGVLGTLVLEGEDSAGSEQVTKFSVVNGALVLSRGPSAGSLTEIGALSGSLVTVANLVFRPINTGRSQAIKIEMTLEANGVNMQRSDKYYGTIILGGSY